MAANEEEEGTSPLLSKEEERRHHPGCPGCDHDRRKDLQTGLPYKEFSYVWMICLTTGTYALLSAPQTSTQILLLETNENEISGIFSLDEVTVV
uniref:Uncharacterized protein n=1 Tax=Aegilops tauschii subsp. strangulata TaxID=200361 RepID=A0A453HQA9_AEGTS